VTVQMGAYGEHQATTVTRGGQPGGPSGFWA
jgi:hypothetical protein